MTAAEKREWYKQGWYMFEVPPVCHAKWDEDAWTAWIDSAGKWQKPQEKKEHE